MGCFFKWVEIQLLQNSKRKTQNNTLKSKDQTIKNQLLTL